MKITVTNSCPGCNPASFVCEDERRNYRPESHTPNCPRAESSTARSVAIGGIVGFVVAVVLFLIWNSIPLYGCPPNAWVCR